jgi:hypothetical protein
MLVLATFTTICVVSVLFLLRFLIALHVESKPASGAVERISPSRFQVETGFRDVAHGLTLVHSSPSRKAAHGKRIDMQAFVGRERVPQFRGASR